MTPDGYIKVNHELSFTNLVPHGPSKQLISTPPEEANHRCWTKDVPQILKDEARKVLTNTYGPKLDGLEMESFRLCW
jgi:hypothetical protein